MKKVRIPLIKGTVRRLPVHRANVAAFGLGRVARCVGVCLSVWIPGVVDALADIVKVEEI